MLIGNTGMILSLLNDSRTLPPYELNAASYEGFDTQVGGLKYIDSRGFIQRQEQISLGFLC